MVRALGVLTETWNLKPAAETYKSKLTFPLTSLLPGLPNSLQTLRMAVHVEMKTAFLLTLFPNVPFGIDTEQGKLLARLDHLVSRLQPRSCSISSNRSY